MKVFQTILTLTLVALVHSEPPVTNQYLPPQTPNQGYLPPTGTFGGSAPSGFSAPGSSQFSSPSSQYGAPAVTSAIFNKPSSSYGAPSQGYTSGGHSGFGSGGQGGYGGGQGGYGGGDEGNYGPAKYEFEYNVQDYPSGQDFGHKESRDGDKTVGRYYVLLPDGRKQIVTYEADENGYRPVITYEQTNQGGGYNQGGGHGGFGGYDDNSQSKFNGY